MAALFIVTVSTFVAHSHRHTEHTGGLVSPTLYPVRPGQYWTAAEKEDLPGESFFCRHRDARDHHTRPQILSYYLQYALIFYSSGESAHQAVVRNSVKKFRQVHINDIGITFNHVPFTLHYRIVCGSAGLNHNCVQRKRGPRSVPGPGIWPVE